MVYQVQTKFRDEPRSRGGLIRVREFTMKDAYSFHRTQEDLEAFYEKCLAAYRRIFARVGLPETVAVKSGSGMMGGSEAHEFMLLCEAGEDTVVTCDSCSYLANREVARSRVEPITGEPQPLEKVHTPGTTTIEQVAEFLGVEPGQTAKAVFYDTDSQGKPVLAIIRGDVEINEAKLARIIGVGPEMASDQKIASIGAVAGYASPMHISPDACRIVADHTIRGASNLVCGANETDYHFKNFNLNRDLPGTETVDIALAREGDGCPDCSGKIALKNGIELGNIFQLGTKYSEAMGMRYLDENGKEQTPLMGCYGIGVGRLAAAAVEARCDKYGPIWPVSIAPWQVQINALNFAHPDVKKTAENLYDQLQDAGIEVLFDDRGERPGVQFAEADLLGIPIRFILSERNAAQGSIEWKRRDSGESGLIDPGEVLSLARERIAEANAEIEDSLAFL